MAEAVATRPSPMSRREFLHYVWLSSILIVLGGTGGAILWFAYPRFREGEFGGAFNLSIAELPTLDSGPLDNPDGRFWLVNTASGVFALYKVCTHLGCLYKWTPLTGRFECPCHGSKFLLNGDYFEGPAPRALDRFVMEAVDDSGNILAASDIDNPNAPLEIPEGATRIVINTGSRISGPAVT